MEGTNSSLRKNLCKLKTLIWVSARAKVGGTQANWPTVSSILVQSNEISYERPNSCKKSWLSSQTSQEVHLVPEKDMEQVLPKKLNSSKLYVSLKLSWLATPRVKKRLVPTPTWSAVEPWSRYSCVTVGMLQTFTVVAKGSTHWNSLTVMPQVKLLQTSGKSIVQVAVLIEHRQLFPIGFSPWNSSSMRSSSWSRGWMEGRSTKRNEVLEQWDAIRLRSNIFNGRTSLNVPNHSHNIASCAGWWMLAWPRQNLRTKQQTLQLGM